jgi:uncharacterized membrane protein
MHRLKVNLAAGFCLLAIQGLIPALGQGTPSAPAAPAVAGAAPAAKTNALGPKIQFQKTDYDFGRAKRGEQVKYTFIFTNTGDEVLEVTGVRACGCITSDFTRKTEPGKTGVVPISFNSSGYSGHVTKAITVSCNDKASPAKVLQFSGTVWTAVDVSPNIVMFNNLSVESPATTSAVKLSNNLEEPITVSDLQSQSRYFSAELKTITPGKEFQVVVSTVPPLPPGSMNGRVTLKTSAADMREVTIQIFANNVQPAVAVTPSQINLTGAPLPAEQVYSVNFVNRAPKPLKLSDPTINAEGVSIQLEETQPGQMYAAKLTFPKGFEIPHGGRVELSVKSSLESSPVIKVPVMQASRPAALVAPIRPPAVSQTIAAPSPQASSH